MELVLRAGVNHIDTAASYGESELRLGPWMERHRDRFFLATKTGERTYAAAHDQIRRSLERLRVTVGGPDPAAQPGPARRVGGGLGPGRRAGAGQEAREAGLVRFIGVTGHGTGIPAHAPPLARALRLRLRAPAGQLHHAAEPRVRGGRRGARSTVCQRAQDVATQTIKAITRAPWDERPHDAATWYEPLRDQGDIDLAVHWVLGHPGLFLNTAGDIHILPRRSSTPPTASTRPPCPPTRPWPAWWRSGRWPRCSSSAAPSVRARLAFAPARPARRRR